jgi:ATP-dependent Lon protease
VTICTALVSAFTGREVLREIGMTGEMTLRGRVLPVGGVREKVLAAYRAGIKTVIMPRKNLKDLVDVPKRARSELNIIPVERVDEVLEHALAEAPKETKTSRPRRKKAAEASAETAVEATVDGQQPKLDEAQPEAKVGGLA